MMRAMRTTITLDPDVAAQLERLTRDRSMTFKEAVNATLRAGLAVERDIRRPTPYVVPTFDLGVLPGIDLRKAAQLATALEDDETLRKTALRK